MTLREAATDFRKTHEFAPWLNGVGIREFQDVTRCQIVALTKYEVPAPLKAKLATHQGWPVVFVVTGRVCAD